MKSRGMKIDVLTLLFSLVAARGNLWIAFRLHRLGSRR